MVSSSPLSRSKANSEQPGASRQSTNPDSPGKKAPSKLDSTASSASISPWASAGGPAWTSNPQWSGYPPVWHITTGTDDPGAKPLPCTRTISTSSRSVVANTVSCGAGRSGTAASGSKGSPARAVVRTVRFRPAATASRWHAAAGSRQSSPPK